MVFFCLEKGLVSDCDILKLRILLVGVCVMAELLDGKKVAEAELTFIIGR